MRDIMDVYVRVMRKRKSGVGAACCALGNENPTQHPGSGEGWYRMHFNEGRRERTSSRKTILSAFGKEKEREREKETTDLSFIVHRRSAFQRGVWLHRLRFVIRNKAKALLCTSFLRYLLQNMVYRFVNEFVSNN